MSVGRMSTTAVFGGEISGGQMSNIHISYSTQLIIILNRKTVGYGDVQIKMRLTSTCGTIYNCKDDTYAENRAKN